MMNIENVVELLKKADNLGIAVWLDGGWGVDALIGKQTRPHNDLDIFVQKKDKQTFIEMLDSEGYKEHIVDFTSEDHTEWKNDNGYIVDLHLFEIVNEANLLFQNEIFPSDVFNGKGIIGEIQVNCLAVEAQILYHDGYELGEKDVNDILLLCETFDKPIPERVLGFKNKNN